MKQLVLRFKSPGKRNSKSRFWPLALKIALSAAAVIYAVYTISQLAAFVLKDL